MSWVDSYADLGTWVVNCVSFVRAVPQVQEELASQT